VRHFAWRDATTLPNPDPIGLAAVGPAGPNRGEDDGVRIFATALHAELPQRRLQDARRASCRCRYGSADCNAAAKIQTPCEDPHAAACIEGFLELHARRQLLPRSRLPWEESTVTVTVGVVFGASKAPKVLRSRGYARILAADSRVACSAGVYLGLPAEAGLVAEKAAAAEKPAAREVAPWVAGPWFSAAVIASASLRKVHSLGSTWTASKCATVCALVPLTVSPCANELKLKITGKDCCARSSAAQVLSIWAR